jgi:uncharacterized protein (DUF1501 family)
MSRSHPTALRRRDWLRFLAAPPAWPRSRCRHADAAALGPGRRLQGAGLHLPFGGNDGFNMLVPTDTTRHNQYLSARGGLALPKASLLPLAGSSFGLHPAMRSLLPAWSAHHLAPVINVGPLAAPLTKAGYLAAEPDSPLIPDNLFSHSDQQRAWESASTDALARTGWGARTAEILATTYPVISLGGNSRFAPATRPSHWPCRPGRSRRPA